MELDNLGPYRILEVLGSGGMGIVYAGVDDQTGQRAAIKVLSRGMGGEASFRERFSSEIDTLKKLRHPHIVELYGYGEQDGQLFFSMELVEGKSLQDELHDGRRFDWKDVIRIAIQVCQALKHAHDHGVIHRDLKPANLIWSAERMIKLSDFGIAKLFGGSHITAAGSVIGTADFMSPEQAEGKPVTHQSDLYSLGSVMYALLARRPPFAAASVPEVLHAVKFDPAPPLHRFSPETPEPVREIIHQLLNKDPNDRPANAYVLSNQLKAMEFGLSAPTRLDVSSDDDSSIEDSESEDADPLESESNSSLTSNMSEGAPTVEGKESTEEPTAVHGARRREDDASRGDTRPAAGERRLTTDSHRDDADRRSRGLDRKSVEPAERESGDPSKASRFIPVDEDQRRSAGETDEATSDGVSWAVWAIGLVIVVLLALIGWISSRPPGADALLAEIERAAQQEDVTRLLELGPEIEQFLERFPDDPRAERVRQYRTRIELDRFSRHMTRLARREDVGDLSPVENAYLEAMSLETTAPDQAAARFRALVDVYSTIDPRDSPDAARCVRMARQRAEQLERQASLSRQRTTDLIEERLRWAIGRRTSDPTAARRVLEGLIALYGDRPWAEELIEQARSELEKL